jgi:hypothetical protein
MKMKMMAVLLLSMKLIWTDIQQYSTIVMNFRKFSESIQRKELTKKHSFKQHQRDTIGYNQASLQSLITEQRKQ